MTNWWQVFTMSSIINPIINEYFIKYWNYAWKHQSLWIFWYRELSVGSPELFLLHHDDTTWRRAQKLVKNFIGRWLRAGKTPVHFSWLRLRPQVRDWTRVSLTCHVAPTYVWSHASPYVPSVWKLYCTLDTQMASLRCGFWDAAWNWIF